MVTALYRRYRPESFAEMIGQSQVTDPLMTALRADRVNHAYLFSGPRGCGKTTSARILARCLNCADGPTDTPCGKCDSCIELGRGGGGSLDVVEIDAASHNGVDDARDLRERAIFAPARDRYKIFILDEAHMVTPQGFNALLKLVEEPPDHVKFIFATTEPEKVLGTIRSRTHHYPFRLVPPGQMLEYVQQLCDAEGVSVAPGVLPLVVRAGGGSPRDTLSLLDQLMAGSEDSTVDYERAVSLLGYTHGALLDEVIDAIAIRDASAAFAGVDRVIQTGQDPRRFVEDLLERLRDLIVVGATSAQGAAAVLRGVPQDEIDRMAQQAASFGQAELSRTADIVNTALTEMTGATSPRLHLELLVARALVPSADTTDRGALARVERLERRVGVTDVAGGIGAAPVATSPAAAAGAPTEVSGQKATPAREPAPAASAPSGGSAPVTSTRPKESSPAAPAGGAASGAPTQTRASSASSPDASAESAPHAPDAPAGSSRTAPNASTESAPAAPAARVLPVGPVSLQQVKDAWPEVLEAVRAAKMNAWMVVFTAQVRELRDGDVLVLGFPSQKDVADLKQQAAPGQGVGDILKRAVSDILGFTPKLVARVDTPQGATESSREAPSAAAGETASARAEEPAPARSTGAAAGVGRGPSSAARSSSPRGSGNAPGQNAAVQNAPEKYDGWATITIPGGPADDGSTAVEDEAAAPETNAAPGVAENPVSAGTAAAAPDVEGSASLDSGPEATRSVVQDAEPDDFGIPSDDDAPPPDDAPPEPPDRRDPAASGPPPARERATSGSQLPRGQRSAPARPSTTGSLTAQTTPTTSPEPQGGAPERSQPARRPVPRTATASGGPQRYGESVVREVLGATFLEEQPHTPKTGFRP
ncbi:DNA polymerase III subunit gamma and tau [Glaciibacter flavus]|uniref:DNA polymerase III subunit gamma and tau n=1 Tax=Orlajensenia flava TaxID=2565934 RepID=UPI003AFF721A